jgi:hypothetical protein
MHMSTIEKQCSCILQANISKVQSIMVKNGSYAKAHQHQAVYRMLLVYEGVD